MAHPGLGDSGFALIAGLVIYNSDTEQSMLSEVTEVDTALLTDDLPLPLTLTLASSSTSRPRSPPHQNTKQPAALH